jgi:hypothetical protein
MRASDNRKRARELYALAKSTPHADDGLVYVLRALELEEAEAPRGRQRSPSAESSIAAVSRSSFSRAKRATATRSR